MLLYRYLEKPLIAEKRQIKTVHLSLQLQEKQLEKKLNKLTQTKKTDTKPPTQKRTTKIDTHTHIHTHAHAHYSYSITASAAPSCMNHERPLNGLRDPRMHMLTARATAIDTRPVMNPITSL